MKKNNLKLIKIFKHQEIYDDEFKLEKNILTDFINDNFINNNDNELKLLKLIYSTIQPILDKYGLKLVFKGGNVMRLINKNIISYFNKLTKNEMLNIFEPFLKQSDNDFAIFIDPNIKNYDNLLNDLSFEIFDLLNLIRNEIEINMANYFYLFNLSNKIIKKIFNELKNKININTIELKPILDRLIISSNKKRIMQSDILIYDYIVNKSNIIYNSINFTLEFYNPKKELIKFILLRTKVNFLLDNKYNIGGELIDIAIPHKNDNEMKKLYNTKKFNEFIKNNIFYEYNNKYDFKYYIINLNYIIHDLYRILYEQFYFPWYNEKYLKRIARLIYFIFLKFINDNKISEYNYKLIKNQYKLFISQLLEISYRNFENSNNYLQDIINANKIILNKINNENDKLKYLEYLTLIIKFSKSIIYICDSMIKYMEGLINIDKKEIYELNII